MSSPTPAKLGEFKAITNEGFVFALATAQALTLISGLLNMALKIHDAWTTCH